jgi:Zn-dependent membrane protease YugP
VFFFDPMYLVFLIPAIVLSLAAQALVSGAFNRWSQVRNSAGLTGVQVAQRLINYAGLNGVGIEGTPGIRTDHFDPTTNVVRLSQQVATQPSVASMAVIAHELGHAQQYQQRSILIQMRSFLVPAMQISPMISYVLILIGLLLNAMSLFQLGILFYGVVVVFMLLTLPVEIDASRRGLKMLSDSGLMMGSDDVSGSRSVLTAAAVTYVAAAVTALLNLLYYISIMNRRR